MGGLHPIGAGHPERLCSARGPAGGRLAPHRGGGPRGLCASSRPRWAAKPPKALAAPRPAGARWPPIRALAAQSRSGCPAPLGPAGRPSVPSPPKAAPVGRGCRSGGRNVTAVTPFYICKLACYRCKILCYSCIRCACWVASPVPPAKYCWGQSGSRVWSACWVAACGLRGYPPSRGSPAGRFPLPPVPRLSRGPAPPPPYPVGGLAPSPLAPLPFGAGGSRC